MMGYVCCALAILASAAFAFPGIPDGTYKGTGRMKLASGLDRTYSAKLTLRGNDIEATYDYGEGKIVPYRATVSPRSALEFDVTQEGKTIGTGYCDNGLCHLDVPEHKAEETWFFSTGSLVRVGSMEHGGAKLVYTEKLVPANSPTNAEVQVLECEGFEFSDTKIVRVFRDDSGAGSLVEIKKGDKQTKRALTKEELAAQSYPISSMHGMTRKIVKKDSAWVLSYGCGEDRPLSCRE